jgi:dihydroorotate dehydrogenase
LFRLTEDGAIINRMGFNSLGIEPFLRHLRTGHGRPIPIGANVGINKEGADPERDYPQLVSAVAPFSDYVVLNVSSPNTPGLRDLQSEARLKSVLAAINARLPSRPPLLVKIAPDLSREGLEAVVETCLSASVQGLIVSNTTVARAPGLRSEHSREAGGLSGKPLLGPSTAMLARAFLLAGGRLGLIGVGGVSTAEDALLKIQAGASLVQLYTAFIYEGPAVAARLAEGLARLLRERGFSHIREAVGIRAAELAGDS